MTTSRFRGWRTLSAFALLTSGFVVSGGGETALAAPPVFINEIHYDNVSTDAGEAIEVAGPAGTDLAGWSLVLYNGNGGTTYRTDALSGVLADQGGGYGTTVVNYASNGIQNGAPDGVALVDDAGNVVQFLSYEGTFTAVGGPADAMDSTDIGVSQDGAGALGNSLQLTGSGVAYEDFTWASEQASTFGAPNTGQTFGAAPADPVVVINEIDYDQPGTDAAEFVELKNTGSAPVSLDGVSLQFVNGNGGAIYNTIDLPAVSLAAGDYFVVCANAATVANCDLDDSPDTNFIQNGAPDAVALSFDGALVDVVSYEGDTASPYTEGSGVGLEDAGDGSISRCPDGDDTDVNNVDLAFTGTISPGAANGCEPPPPAEVCGDPGITLIHDVQGGGLASPLAGTEVAVEGIVVGDFQDLVGTDGDLNGFHIQEEDADADADADTSEGIFVYQGSNPTIDVNKGDHVRVRGVVSEFNGLTELSSSLVLSCSSGNTLPAATIVTLPVTSVDDFEAFEGMVVTFTQDLVISEYFNFDRFGEIVLTSERHLTPTAEFEPGPAAIQAAADFLLDRITLDDGRSAQNPDPAIHPNGGVFGLDNLFRGGDTVANVTGVMDYGFGLYRVQPTQGADYTNTNPRTTSPDEVGGNVKVASFNVLNYFTTLDNSGPKCGPLRNQGCRGADNTDEFTRQRDKIVAALAAIDADVFGLMEIENNDFGGVNDDAVGDLVDSLNAVVGADTYDLIDTGTIGTDAIKVAIIYKPASVTPSGAYAVLDSSVDARFDDTKNRPALAQSFIDNTTGGIFTVAVNHLKSKGSACADVGDPDLGDGAANCNLTRKAAAEALVDWAATDPTGSGDPDFLIIGDLNSYDKEDPIDALIAGGDDTLGTSDDYTDLVFQFLGEDAYSYVFDGQTGYLDSGLANASLAPQVTGATIWHINADEPDLIDYDTSFKGPNQDAIYAPDPYRSSDHDPVIIGLDVCDEIAPTFEKLSVTPDVLWSPNHKYVDIEATVVVDDNFDTTPTVTLVSVTSNEPDDANGNGDGKTVDDIVIVDDFNFQLRAERAGNGSGRTYTITYEVSDDCGNTTQASVTVFVPLDNRIR